MLQFLDYIILGILISSLIYYTLLYRKMKKVSSYYNDFIKVSEALKQLLEDSHYQIIELQKLYDERELLLNNNIKSADAIISDMKFIANRAEKLMDTLSNFIKLDNNLKRIINESMVEKTHFNNQGYSHESFATVLNFITQRKQATVYTEKKYKLKNLILKISENYSK